MATATSPKKLAWAPNWLTEATPASDAPELPRANQALIRTWPRARRDRWADLAELGEEQGLPIAQAEAYAFLAVSNEIECDGPEPEASPRCRESFAGWSPTLEPISLEQVGREAPIPTKLSGQVWLLLKDRTIARLGEEGKQRAVCWCVDGGKCWYRVPRGGAAA